MKTISAPRFFCASLLALVVCRFLAAAETPARPAAASVEELAAQIETHIAQPKFNAALWGVKIASLETGKTIFEHHADRLLSPASNSKLYASALALDVLGGDYRIATPIFGTAKLEGDGTLHGDLIVSGRGDPSWKVRRTDKNFFEIFAPFVAELKRAGVKRVTGDLIADATYFVSLPNGSGWTADDLNDYYGAEISALTLEENYAELKVTPAATEGQPCTLALVQPHTGLVLDNRTRTVAKDRPTRLEQLRIFGENVVHIFGDVPVGAAVQTIDVTVPRPAQWFAGGLKEALTRAGIRVDGNARSLRWPDVPAVNAKSVKLGEVVSPPLRDLITALMKPSQNLETDLIFAHVGESLRVADTPATRTSEQLALGGLREFFRKNNLPVEEVRFDEGSGLSRNNLTTANATLALVKFMNGHQAGPDFFNSLPIAGVDGTLRRRMKATAAEGNVRAKTGTLRWAAALSGHVTSAAGERLIFSLMLNRSVQPQGRPASAELDEIAVMLARFSGRTTAAASEASAGSR